MVTASVLIKIEISLPEDLLARIDEARRLVPRSAWIRDLVTRVLDTADMKRDDLYFPGKVWPYQDDPREAAVRGPACSENGILGYTNEEIRKIVDPVVTRLDATGPLMHTARGKVTIETVEPNFKPKKGRVR